VLSLYALVCN